LLLALFLLHGCATKPTEWSAGTRSQAELDAAHRHCRAELKKEADAALRPQGVPALPPTAYRNAIDRAYFASIDQLSAVIAFRLRADSLFRGCMKEQGFAPATEGSAAATGLRD
jgi:hypothetical protein